LLSGELITAFNGQDINLSTDLPHRVGRVKPGTTAKLNIVRNGKTKVINLEIGALPDADSQQLGQMNSTPDYQQNRLGIVVGELSAKQQRAYGNGVVVQQVMNGRSGAMSGIVTGDVISMIYGERIHSLADFDRIVKSLPSGRSVPMQIVRRGAAMFIPLRLAD
jgi:serine protease Do